jgi:adenosylcobinamide-GDP ribazoletransferase
MQSILSTSRFLTRLPLPGSGPADIERIHAGWFPLVGLAVGVLMAATDIALAAADWNVRNALVVAVWVGVTGGIHLDALMDSADGLAAPRGESRDAMRSSVHSVEGAAAGLTAISLAWIALSQLDEQSRLGWLICTPVLGRAAIVLGYRCFKPGVDVGPVTQGLAVSARGKSATASLTVALVACISILGASAVLGLAATIAAALVFRHHTGGLGGDHYGALAVIAEVTVLIAAVVQQPLSP